MRRISPLEAETAARLSRRDRAALTVLALVLLLPGTFGVSLVDRDESWYAQVSREMLASGDWLIPRYLGQPWFAKPPLLYWCVAASYAVFGVHAWAARLVSVLAMVGVVHLLGTLAAELYNRRTAWIASVSFIAAGMPAVVGKMVLTDALLLLWCLLAVLALFRSATRGPTVARAIGFWVSVGLAILTKGPAVVPFVGAFALALRAWPAARRWTLSRIFWLTSPLCLVVAAPWYVYAATHALSAFWQRYVWFELLFRLGGMPFGHGGPPGYYLVFSLPCWLPWTALVPGAVMEMWRARRVDRRAWLLLIWCGLPWLLLELLPSKLPHYVLPCYVPLAIMLGRMWDMGLARAVTPRERAVLGVWAMVPLVLGAGLSAAAVHWRSLAWSLGAGLGGGVLIAGFGLVAWLVRRGRLATAWRAAVGVTGAFHVLAGLCLLPGFEPYRLSRVVPDRANALTGAGGPVLVCGFDEPSVFFYLQRPARRIDAQQLPDAFHDPTRPQTLIIYDEDLFRTGILSGLDSSAGSRFTGLNYENGRRATVWVIPIRSSGRATPH